MLRASTVPLGVGELASALDVHPNTVRFHLDALVETGQVERVDVAPMGPGRPPSVFRARPGMDPSGPRSYRLLAAMLVGSFAGTPDSSARAVELGRRWGADFVEQSTPPRALTTKQVENRLTGLLEDLGFSPESRSAGGRRQIGLRHCPFLELADSQADVICPLHLGLMQGALEKLGSSETVERLDPFVEPDLCLAHLSRPANPK